MPSFVDEERILTKHLTAEWQSEFDLARKKVFYPELRKLEKAGLAEHQAVEQDWLWRITEEGTLERRRLLRRSRRLRKLRLSQPPKQRPSEPEPYVPSGSSSSSSYPPAALSPAI
jgi:hypothetical protein